MLPFGEIHSVEFYIKGDDDNRRGVMNILSKDTIGSDGKPVHGGVNDIRMGTTSKNYKCGTCFQTKSTCVGHNGFLELNYPVQNPLFRNHIVKWLKIICHNCGKLITETGNGKTNIKDQVKTFKNPIKTNILTSCPHCGVDHPNIIQDKNEQLHIYKEYMVDEKLFKERIMNHEISAIFEKIDNSIVKQLGYNPELSHPKKYILRCIPVATPVIRPDVLRASSKSPATTEITNFYKNIFDINSKIPPNTINPDDRDLIDTLDLIYSTMIKGSPASAKKTKVVHSSNKEIGSLASRLPEKIGRVRGTMMGKRVFFVCRSVISCDPTIKIDEVGVPLKIARTIQIPETVHSWNIVELNKYFYNKDITYPGCTKIYKKSNNNTYHVANIKSDFTLEIGDVIYRNLIDGDIIALNRAPSLTPSAICVHRVRVRPQGQTLTISELACKLYNADFDGDEMNGHFFLSKNAQIEVDILMSVKERLISSQYGAPAIGAYMDSLVGASLFTQGNNTFSKFDTMQFIANIDMAGLTQIKDAASTLTFNKDRYTNYEVSSILLPYVNYSGKSSMYEENLAHIIRYDEKDIKVLIDKGIHKQGVLDKKAIGDGAFGSIIHAIKNRYGTKVVLDYIFNLQQTMMMYLKSRGFSIGLRDILISLESIKGIQEITNDLIENSKRITDRLNNNQIIPPIGITTEEFYEILQLNELRAADDYYNIVMKDIDTTTNSMYKLISSGSKGNKVNFLQISSALGQQTLNGLRIPQNFGYNRTLPYFTTYDTNPEARGFIVESYITGLGLPSMIFASMESRYALITNALMTATTGAQSRTGIKNLESIVVNNLRAAAKDSRIVQRIYGDSGIDPRLMDVINLPLMNISTDEFNQYHYNIKSSDINAKYKNKGLQDLFDKEFDTLKSNRETFREIMLKMEADSGINNKLYGNNIKTPLNMNKIINDVIYQYRDLNKDKDYNPGDAIVKITELCDTLVYSAFNDMMLKKKTAVPKYWKSAMTFSIFAIRQYLNTKNLIKKEISNAMLSIILNDIYITMANSFIDYGSVIGITAAQSINQPMMQFVLNSKHRSGGGGTKTDTLVRIGEVLGARPTENMKNTAMVIQVRDDIASDIARVQEVANFIEMMSVGRFVDGEMLLFYEKFREPVHPDYKHEIKMINQFIIDNPVAKPPNVLLHWCIRFELDRREMILKNMSLGLIVRAIQREFRSVYVVYSSETSEKLVVRCYVKPDMFRKEITPVLFDNLMREISNVVIRGVPNIITAEVEKDTLMRNYVDVDGSIKTKKIHYITTSGTNLQMMLSHEMVDPYHIQTDSIIEVAETYGIEAGREKLLNELKTINSATIDKGVCYPHISIYADEMTYMGKVVSAERNGLSKREVDNVMLRVSSASPVQVLEEAAIFSRKDPLHGISAQLMVGAIPQVGSTYNTVVINNDFIKEFNKGTSLDDL